MEHRTSLALACTFVFTFAAALSAAASAQEDAVVVTAIRFPQQRLDAPPGMIVINREQIASSTAANLPEVLVKLGGLVGRNLAGSPDLQLDMRGFGITGDQNTLVLVDGIRVNAPDLSTTRLTSIPLHAVERIEIMPGSGAVLYGEGATGGTINIITRGPAPGERSAYGFAGAGSYGTRELRASGTAAGDRLGLTVHAGHLESDNYRANNELRQDSVRGDLRYQDGASVLGLKFGSDWQRLRLPGSRNEVQLENDRRGTAKPHDYADSDGDTATLYARHTLGRVELAADFSFRDQFTERRDTTSFGTFLFAHTKNRAYAFSPRARVALEPLGMRSSLVVGADFNDSDYLRKTWIGFFPAGAAAGVNSTTQSARGAYVQYDTQATEALKLSGGWRTQRVTSGNDISFFGPLSTASRDRELSAGELAARYAVTPALALFGKLGTSFRFANADENAQTATGALLDPQTARHREAGVELARGASRARVALYRIDLENEIYFSPTVVPFGANTNLSPTYRSGVEANAAWPVGKTYELGGRVAYQVAKFKSGVYGGVDVSGKDVPLVPRVVASLLGTWRAAPATTISGTVTHIGHQRYDNDQDNTFPRLMPAYTLADVKLMHDRGGWRLAAGVTNLTDKKYYSYGIYDRTGFSCATPICAYPQAGRALFLSAERRL
jgi:iron complex outermembrane receptor protein